MKIAKFVGVLFGLAGTVLMVGAIAVCLMNLDAPVKIVEYPQAAMERSEEMMEAVAQGNYAAAAKVMYGQPELGADRAAEEEVGQLVWDAFVDSIAYEFAGECYATDSGIARKATVTTLDISSVTENLRERSQALLSARVEAATDVTELYNGEEFREDVVMEVLKEAVRQALREDAKTVSRDVTMNLIYRDGQWWVVPDQALLKAISGNVS